MVEATARAPAPCVPLGEADVEATIPAVLARRTAGHGERPAVCWGRRELSYAELARESARVARAIGGRLAGPDAARVVLLLDDRIQQIVAALGVLEAGHAFVPLDPSQPAARLGRCVADAEPALIVAGRSTRGLADEMARVTAGVRLLDLDDDADTEAGLHDARGRAARPDDIAYIIYTSGSTGGPKGVIQLHRNVLASVREYTQALRVGADDRFAHLGSYAFGSPLIQVFRALLNGATVCRYDVKLQGLAGLAGWLEEQEISLYSSVPSLFRHWTADLTGAERFPRMRFVSLGGEAVRRRDFEAFRRVFAPPCRFVNSLGMTEMPGFRRLVLDHDAQLTGEIVPAGAAVAGIDVLVQDEHGRDVAPGEAGELVLRSRTLSPGYWRRPDLTEAAFRPDPADPRARLFRTGDRGRLRADGCLEHQGRADQQVKIRGQRVETAEVEAAILRLGGMREAAVVDCAGPDGETRLVAFVVAAKRKQAGVARLRAALTRALPEAMVPARFVFRAALPALPGGKLDRGALLEAAQSLEPARGDRPARPDDPLQRQLAAIWERFLRIDGIGPQDDFFELGGHSLIAVRVIARIQRDLGLALPLTALVEAPTVARLAEAIRARDATTPVSPVLALNASGSLPPLHCVPGAGGDAFALHALARRLGPDQPVRALQWPGLCGHGQPESVEALAAWFLERLPPPPATQGYRLLGTSFGGVVAYEMAQQLRAAGQRVELLVLLASNRPGHPALRPGLGPRARLELARRWLLPRGGKDRWSRRYLVLGLRERLGRLAFQLDRALVPGRTRAPFRWRFAWVREHCYRAADRYRPAPYPGRTVIFRNAERAPDSLFQTTPDLGWGELLTGPVERLEIPGAHGQELSSPGVDLLARELQRLL